MFDIGFAELLIIAVVSLIVIGPERLPETVRTLSAWISRFRRSFNEIKREVQLELHNDAVLRDLQNTSTEMRSQLQELQDLGRMDKQPNTLAAQGEGARKDTVKPDSAAQPGNESAAAPETTAASTAAAPQTKPETGRRDGHE